MFTKKIFRKKKATKSSKQQFKELDGKPEIFL